jgi:hypothetical protein
MCQLDFCETNTVLRVPGWVQHTWGAHAWLPCATGAESATVTLLRWAMSDGANLYLASMGVWVLPAA